MVILQIEIADLAVHDVECNAPVARYGNTPGACPVTGEAVDSPAGRTPNALHVHRTDKDGENVAYPRGKIAPNATVVVILEEAPQPSVADAANLHSVKTYGITVQMSSAERNVPRWNAVTGRLFGLSAMMLPADGEAGGVR